MAKWRRSGAEPLRGEVRIPGDKSISHRALLLSALSYGPSHVRGLGPGDDVKATLEALGSMGASIEELGEGTVRVAGFGIRGATEPDRVLDARNSGTALRTLLPIAATGDGLFVFTGDETLNRRPMLRVVSRLREMGASILGRKGGEFAPLVVEGMRLTGTTHHLDIASAQVKTCLLLAGLAAEGTTSVSSPAASRDHTERMLRHLGVVVGGDALTQTIDYTESVPGAEWRIPADPSSAMFLIAAAALIPGSAIEIPDISLNPLRIGAFEVLRSMGGNIVWEETDTWGGEPVGRVRVEASELRGVEVRPEIVPSLIDEIPILCILGSFASGVTRFNGAAELKVKESDRIASMTSGLAAVGAVAEAHEDGLSIEGGHPLQAGVVDAHGDHRIAMSFAVAGLAASANITIRGWSSVETSFPGFLETMKAARRD